MSLNERQQEVVNSFELYDDWMDKYQYLVDLGNNLEPFNPEDKVDSNLIRGCQSQVWLTCEVKDDRLYFYGDSDAIIVKGIVSLLVNTLSSSTAEEIIDSELFFIDQIGLKEHLSPTRSNGLLSMVHKIRYYAMAHKMRLSGNIL